MRIGDSGKIFFMGDSFYIKKEPDSREKVAMKKGIYQKQAMYGVMSVKQAEGRIDSSIAEIRDSIRMLLKEREQADTALRDLDQKMAQAKADYNVADDSQEEKDLDLLKKQFDIEHFRRTDYLTEEEQIRLKEMKRTDYHNLSMNLYELADDWRERLDDSQKDLSAAVWVIREVRRKRLESDAMEEAEQAKEELMEAASKEAVGILKDEAVDALNEKAEELKETAEAGKEEKEIKEEQIRKAKEKKEEAEAKTDAIRENASEPETGVLADDRMVRELDAEIKKVLEEQKRLEEELKGLRVNLKI